MRGQSSSSFVPSVIKTNVPLNNDDHVHKDLVLQRYWERLEKLSQQDRMSKLCTDAKFLTTIEIGQYFMTKDTEEFSQFTDSVAVVSTLCQEMKTYLNQKGWIRVNTKIGPVLEITTCCLQSKYGVEIRIKSVNKDNSHSRVRISHGYELEQQRPKWKRARHLKMQFDEYALKLNASYFASRSKARAKPQRRDSASSSTRTIPIEERIWTDIEKTKIFALRLSSVEETDSSSSSWK